MVNSKRPLYLFGKKFIENLGHCTFGQIVECNQLLKKERNWKLIPEVVSVIYGVEKEKVERACIIDVYPAVCHIIEQIGKLNKILEKAMEMDLKNEEMQAGAEDFQKYGVFITIDNLAQGDILRHKEIEELTFNHVVTKIQLNRDKELYNEKLNEIMNRKLRKK